MFKSFSSYASLPLRLLFGFSFIYYGFPKIFDSATHGFTTGMLTSIGVPAPDFMTYVVGAVELLGGLALLTGTFTSFASLALLPIMLVGMFTVHIYNGFSFMNIVGMTENGPQFGGPGYEVNLLYIAGLLTLSVLGAESFSVDNYLMQNSKLQSIKAKSALQPQVERVNV